MTSDSRNGRRAYPRAPTQEEWDVMTPEERARVVEELPNDIPWEERGMPPGMLHSEAVRMAEDLVKTRLDQQERTALVAAELMVHYPGEEGFIPDLLVVLDVDTRPRMKWVVSTEGKGLDWVLEVLVAGDRAKDLVKNVKRYAELGIPEYVVFDRTREEVRGYRLASPGDKEYTPIEPRNGRVRSEVLGLELGVVDGELFAWVNGEPLLPGKFYSSLKEVAERSLRHAELEAERREEEARRRAGAERRAEAEARQRAAAERHAEEEARLREEAERQLAQLKAELERLRR